MSQLSVLSGLVVVVWWCGGGQVTSTRPGVDNEEAGADQFDDDSRDAEARNRLAFVVEIRLWQVPGCTQSECIAIDSAGGGVKQKTMGEE